MERRNEIIKYETIKKKKEVLAYIRKGDQILGAMGFSDHAEAHVTLVAERAATILKHFERPDREIELAKIAGFMHDIGNCINRKNHAEYGALLANDILKKAGMSTEDRLTVVSAISHHDEGTGMAFDPVSAALIIADKTDVRRSRVRPKERSTFDIHDRVNYAVTGSNLKFSKDKSCISLNLQIDESICSMYEYFEIFLGRMVMCRRAAGILGTKFKLMANGQKVL
ncbi:MAG: HD domain-containing protein [Anaerovoracaceae bacterium]|jgi:metal-dependent HD superfamily phosphatase/phosphodiesterase